MHALSSSRRAAETRHTPISRHAHMLSANACFLAYVLTVCAMAASLFAAALAPRVARAEGEGSNLRNFVDSVTITGPSVTNNSDGSISIRQGTEATVTLHFKEGGEEQQFDMSGDALTYSIDPTMVTRVINNEEVSISVKQGTQTYVITGNTFSVDDKGNITLNWNTAHENYSHLVNSTLTEFDLSFRGSFGSNSTEYDFGNGHKIPVNVDTRQGATVSKSGQYWSSDNKIHYTLTVHSYGENTNVVVNDAMSTDGSALTFDAGSVTTNKGEAGTVAETTNGFTYTIGSMADGDEIQIYYTASVDLSQVSGKGTAQQTGNSVKVTTDQDSTGTTDSNDMENQISYSSMSKAAGTQTGPDASGIATVPWTVYYNQECNANMKGNTIRDSIAESSQGIMHYTGSVTVYVYEKSTDGSGTQVVPNSDAKYNLVTTHTNAVSLNASQTSFSYPITDDGNYLYVLKYNTTVDMGDRLQAIEVSNDVTDDTFSTTGKATVQPGDTVEIEKEYLNFDATTAGEENITWKVTFTIPEAGLRTAVLEDLMPGVWVNGYDWLYDSIDSSSISVSIAEGEDTEGTAIAQNASGANVIGYEYKGGIKDNSNGQPYFELTFYSTDSNGDKQSIAFPASTSKRTVTVTFKTNNNHDWQELYNNSSFTDRAHKNTATLHANDFDFTATAQVVPSNSATVKKVANNGQPAFSLAAADGTTYPVWYFKVFYVGELHAGDTIVENFNGDLFRIVEPSDYGTLTPDPSATLSAWGPVDGAAQGNSLSYVKPDSWRINKLGTEWDVDGNSTSAYLPPVTNGNTVTFTITQDAIGSVSGYTGNVYTIEYLLIPKDADTVAKLERDNTNPVLYDNTVVWAGNSSENIQFTYQHNPTGKGMSDLYAEMSYNSSKVGSTTGSGDSSLRDLIGETTLYNVVKYTLTINPEKRHLGEAGVNTITATDTISSNQSIVYETINVESITFKDSSSHDATEIAALKQQINWVVSGYTTTFSDIPNEAEVVITYYARVNQGEGKWSIDNTLTVNGASTRSSETVEIAQTAGGTGLEPTFSVLKCDASSQRIRLAGAEFTLYKAASNQLNVRDATNDQLIGTFTTNADGIATFGGTGNTALFSNQYYYFIETKAPTGYAAQTETKTENNVTTTSDRVFWFRLNDTSDYDTYTYYYGETMQLKNSRDVEYTETHDSLTVNKVDQNNNAVSDATFTLYSDARLTNAVATYNTSTFEIKTEDLASIGGTSYLPTAAGSDNAVTLYLKETTVPDGYTSDGTVHNIVITRTDSEETLDTAAGKYKATISYAISADGMTTSGTSKSLAIVNTTATGTLQITKNITITGATLDDAHRQNISFRVTGPDDYEETFTLAGTSGSTGPQFDGDTLTLTGLKPGDYTVTETVATAGEVQGYTRTTTYEVTEGEGTAVTGSASVKVEANETSIITVTNKYDKREDSAVVHDSLVITKVRTGTDTRLNGAEFSLYDNALCEGDPIATYSTASHTEGDGTAIIHTEDQELKDKLPTMDTPTTLYLKETRAPSEAYTADATIREVQISAQVSEAYVSAKDAYVTTTTYTIQVKDGADWKDAITVSNDRTTSTQATHHATLTIYKTDDTRPTGNKISGAVFGLYSDEDCRQEIRRYTTDAAGGKFSISTDDTSLTSYLPTRHGDTETLYLKELSNAGYAVPGTVWKVEISVSIVTETVDGNTETDTNYSIKFNGSSESTPTCTITNTREKGSLTIVKQLEGVATLTNEQKDAITFTVEGPTDFTTTTIKLSQFSASNGTYTYTFPDEVPTGTYKVSETNELAGYGVTTTYWVGAMTGDGAEYVTSDQVVVPVGASGNTVTFKNSYSEHRSNVYTPASVTINKIDAATEGSANPSLIPGATFTLYNNVDCLDEHKIGEYTGDRFQISTDDSWFADLLPTADHPEDVIFYLKETEAPAGYSVGSTDQPIKVTISLGEPTKVYVSSSDSYQYTYAYAIALNDVVRTSLNVTNTRDTATLTLHKTISSAPASGLTRQQQEAIWFVVRNTTTNTPVGSITLYELLQQTDQTKTYTVQTNCTYTVTEEIRVGGEVPGYSVTTTYAVDGTEATGATRATVVASTKNATYAVEVTNTYEKNVQPDTTPGTFTIHKLWEDTTSTPHTTGPLGSVEFSLYTSEDAAKAKGGDGRIWRGVTAGDEATGATVTIGTDDLPSGNLPTVSASKTEDSKTFYLIETSHPQGYHGDETVYEVVVNAKYTENLSADETYYVGMTTYTITCDEAGSDGLTVTNTVVPEEDKTVPAQITVTKTQTDNSDIVVPGAQYGLFASEDEADADNAIVKFDATDSSGSFVISTENDAFAQRLSEDFAHRADQSASSATFTYWLREMQAPEGYALDPDPDKVTVIVSVAKETSTTDPDQTINVTTYTMGIANDDGTTDTETHGVSDDRLTGSLAITKVVNVTGAALTAEQLANITFTVKNDSGEVVKVFKYADMVNANGVYTVADLPTGTYTVEETNVDIAGYARTTTFSVTGGVTVASDETAELTITNEYRQETAKLTITKTFAGGAASKLTDAQKAAIVFVVTNSAGTEVARFTYADMTDGSKTLTMTPDTYTVTELNTTVDGLTLSRTFAVAVTAEGQTATPVAQGSDSARLALTDGQVGTVAITNTYTTTDVAPRGAVPRTGDDMNTALPTLLAAGAAVSLGVALWLRRRRDWGDLR